MSALQFLREKAGVFVAGIIGFSLFLFVVSDFFGRGRSQRLKQKKYYEIGEIGGEYISYQDYEQKLQNLLEIYKLSGRSNVDEATNESLREQTWQQMVREKILEPQYKKLGIGVSNEEVNDMVLGNNPHQIVQQLFTDQKTGAFNKSFLVNFLKQTEVDETAKKYWLFFENQIIDDRTSAKYNTLIAKGLYVTSKQAEFEKNLNMNTADFSYILKNYASVSDSSIKVYNSDMESYYAKHKENYKRTAMRDIEYVSFDIAPSEDDIKQTEQWINKTKEDFEVATEPVEFINLSSDSKYNGFFVPITSVPEALRAFASKEDTKTVFGPYVEDGSYKVARLIATGERPDSVHARHILLSVGKSRSMDEARHQADSLVRLLRTGTPFENLAKSVSDDQGSSKIGGDLGWFTEGRMVLPFNNACFTAKKGDIKTVESSFGVHIIEILAESKPVKKYNIGVIDRKVVTGNLTTQKYYSQASQFAGTYNTYDKFLKAIADQKLNKRVANSVGPQQKALPGLENARPLIMALFQGEQGKIILDNNQQAVFEVGDKYVVAYCTKVQEDGIAPLKDVEPEVKYSIVKDRKADIISAEFKKYASAGKSLDDIAQSMGLKVEEATNVNFRSYSVAGAGTEPNLVAAASVARQGVVSGPVEGNNGVYLLSVNNIKPAQNDDITALRKRLTNTYQMRGMYEAYEALRKDAKITDKRYKFY